MEETAKVCRACRSRAQGRRGEDRDRESRRDMHSTELVRLIEAAGRDYVGVNLDSGNALWTLEDPMDSLETLGPLAIPTSLRDSAVWRTERGARVQWVAMGEGDIDLKAYFARFRELCPGLPVHIETISGRRPRLQLPAAGLLEGLAQHAGSRFAHFIAIAERGKPRQPWTPPAGERRAKAEQGLPAPS